MWIFPDDTRDTGSVIQRRKLRERDYYDDTPLLQVCVDGVVQDTEADDGEESEVT